MAFSGRATYDDFDSIAEDVSDIISMISPHETPLLDFLGDAERPGTNVAHEWLEDALSPGTLTASTAIDSLTVDTSFQVAGNGDKFVVGDILRMTGSESLDFEELMQVTVIVGAESITVSRGFGSIGPSSLAPGGTIELVSNASLEGKDAGTDISKARDRLTNYMQIFDKAIQVSATEEAVSKLGGIMSEMDYQTTRRSKEILRDLERQLILGETSGNSIGSDTAYRSFKGAWRYITTNVHSVATFSESFLSDTIRTAWDNGGTELDVITTDALWKREIDALSAGRIRTEQDDLSHRTEVRIYQSSYGDQAVLLNRWMPIKSYMVLSSERTKIIPLQRRSFQLEALSKAGDYTRAHIVGEYTHEHNQESGHVKAYQNG